MQQTKFINDHEQILRASRQIFQINAKLGMPLRCCWQMLFIFNDFGYSRFKYFKVCFKSFLF